MCDLGGLIGDWITEFEALDGAIEDNKCEKSKDRDCEALSGAMEDRKCEKSKDREYEALSGVDGV